MTAQEGWRGLGRFLLGAAEFEGVRAALSLRIQGDAEWLAGCAAVAEGLGIRLVGEGEDVLLTCHASGEGWYFTIDGGV